MTRIAIWNQPPTTSAAQFPAALLFAAVLSCLSAQTYAEESAKSSRSSESVNARQAANLEKQFWECDYAATTRGVGLGEGAMCGEVYEDLKRSKFRGDFQAMFSWWHHNKAAEHLALAEVSRTIAAPKADQVTSR